MGNCRFCNQTTNKHCSICFVWACTQHMTMHYFHSQHKIAAAQQGIPLDENGKPLNETTAEEE